MKHGCLSLLVLCQFLVTAVPGLPQARAATPAAEDPKRPKIALVLSGGGALGYAHIGVLKVMEELHVPVDYVVGTSMGALVGGAYAAGVSPTRMQEIIAKTDIEALFDDTPPRSKIAQTIKRDGYKPLFDMSLGFNHGTVELPSGASAGYKFELFLKELIGLDAAMANLNFDDLPIYDAFTLGGPNRLSGLRLDQLNGSRYDLCTLNYYYQVASLPPQLGRGIYVGASLETGRINDPLMVDPWERIMAGSLYCGADTVLGAVYLGYGYSSLKEGSFYLVIGPQF